MAEGGIGTVWDEEIILNDDDLFSAGPEHILPNFANGLRHRQCGQACTTHGRKDRSDPMESTSDVSDLQESDGSAFTECPICLETLDRPKALPCLHTFCQVCLDSFITEKANAASRFMPFTSFPCPICRRASQPLNSSKPHKEWAELFPTNNTMLELIRVEQLPLYSLSNTHTSKKTVAKIRGKKTKQENKFCGNCKTFNKKNVKANLRCEECSVNLCETCDSILHLHDPEKCHRRVYVDSEDIEIQIKLSPLAIVDPRHFESKMMCDTHGKRYDYFCMSHKCPLCVVCMREEHSTCDGVQTFREYSRILKRGHGDLKVTLNDSVSAMDALVGLFTLHVGSISSDRESSLDDIRDLRSGISNYLDYMERELKEHITEVSQSEEEFLSSVTERCEAVKTGLARSLVRLNAALQENDESRIISAALFCHFQVQQCKEFIQEISTFHSVPRLSVLLNPLLTATLNLETFGETNFVREKTELPSSVRKLLPLNARRAREVLRFNVRTIDDTSTCGITSALYLPHNQVMLVDFPNKSVKLFSDYGHLIHQLRLPGGPWDICQVDNHTFAVTLPFQQTIMFIERDPHTLTLFRLDHKIMKVNVCCYGVTYFRGEIVISCPTQKKAALFSFPEGLSRNIPLKLFNGMSIPCWQLATSTAQREVISTHDGENGGIVKFTVADNLSEERIGPNVASGFRGCDVDREGNIYVCGRKSKNIVQVSPKSGSRALLSSAHGLKEPATIAIHGDHFLVAEVASDNIGIFELF